MQTVRFCRNIRTFGRVNTQFNIPTTSTIRTINTQTYSYHSKNYSRFFYISSGIIGLGTGIIYMNEFSAEGKPSYKDQLVGKYENRIREMSSPEKIFEYFATVKKGSGVDKQWFMKPSDFIRAITPYSFKEGSEVGMKKSNSTILDDTLLEVLTAIDQDGDGLISFSEFIFFSTLLAIPPKYFKVAFNLFDEDGNGSVSANEFKEVMRLLRESNPLAKAQRSNQEAINSAGICPLFFGKDGKQELEFETFEIFLTNLREAVLKSQFLLLSDEDGSVSAKDYALNLASYGNMRHMSEYLARAEKLEDSNLRISYEEYRDFNIVLESLSAINFALSSFMSLGEPFNREQLKHAAKIVSGVDLSDSLLHIVFFLFDKDGDGKLDYHEFVGVLEGRQTFGLSKPRDSGFVRFANCLKNCWENETYSL